MQEVTIGKSNVKATPHSVLELMLLAVGIFFLISMMKKVKN